MHSEAGVRGQAELEGHRLGDMYLGCPKELLHTIQETGEEAGRPRQHVASSEAPRELVLHFSEHEGSPGVGGDDSSRTQHQVDLHKDEGYDAEKVETG
jgi:hypothetical protein